MVISHNLQAMNAQRQLGNVSTDIAKNTEKLSSGYRINRAADDAAGLSISEKMRKQIRGLSQASENSQHGVSFVQIADGALTEVHDMLDRMVELTVQAANGTNSSFDRSAIQKEIDQLTKEINRVQETTQFNTIPVFSENGHSPDEGIYNSNIISAAILDTGNSKFTFAYIGSDGNASQTQNTTATGKVNSGLNKDFADFVVNAASSAASKITTAYPSLAKASSNVKIGLNVQNIDGKNNTLASAQLSMRYTSEWTQMTYTMNIDSSDYNPASFSTMSDTQKADFAATIAHEMTHLIMQDTLTGGMIGDNTFPTWFIEGTAQTSSGDGGWVYNGIGARTDDASIKSYMSKLESLPYGAGYLATMALGYEVAKAKNSASAVDPATIKDGLNTLFGELVKQGQNQNLNTAINATTNGNYQSLSDFETKFKSGEPNLLSDVKSILTQKNNANNPESGSLLASSLGEAQSETFKPSNLIGSSNVYELDPSATAFANSFGTGFPTVPQPVRGARHGVSEGGEDINVHAGADADMTNKIAIKRYDISAMAIFDGDKVDVMTEDSATKSIDIVGMAKERVSRVRSYYGAIQNRLEHTIKNLDNVVENTTAAESQIRDTDMASEMVKYTKNNILMQAGQSMLTQANQSTQGVMSLLQ
ncbi:MAG: flagellin [Lachnospiraceae bacterium]|nr:flagellin [Lachnospiraceae bacterium]